MIVATLTKDANKRPSIEDILDMMKDKMEELGYCEDLTETLIV